MTAANDMSVLHEGYTKDGQVADDSLIIKNNIPAYSNVKNDRSYTLDGGSYYKLTVVMQVYLPVIGQPEDFKGAYVGIDGTDYAISNIRSTTDERGRYVFREFNLYIKTSGTAPSESTEEDDGSSTSTTTTITVVAGIGGQGKSERAAGTLIINNISVTAIDSTQFDEAKASVETSSEIGRTDFIADYTGGEEQTTEEEDTTTTETEDASGNNWYIYISVILAVIIVIAVIAALVRFLAIRRKKNGEHPSSERLTYDRTTTLLRQHNAREGTLDDIKTEGYDAFDEDIEDRIEMLKVMAEAESLAAENADNAAAPAPVSTDSTTAESAEEPVESATETATENAEQTAEGPAEDSTDSTATENAEQTAEGSTEGTATENAEQTEGSATAEDAESAEGTDADNADSEEEYTYSDEIEDFTPSEERRKAFEEARAEKARKKAAKEAERKAEEEARARLEEERREATRRYNKWDDFED